MTRSLVRLAPETPSLVAIDSPKLSQYYSRRWAIPQLTVEDAMRRRICQYRHGFSHVAPLP